MIMELIVLATSILRLLLVSVVYLLNIRGLLRLTWKPRNCVHALTTGAALLAGILYLSSWTPYIAYTLANGHWLLLGPRKHCLLQHFVCAEIGAVFLALLAVRLTYRCLVTVYKRPIPSARAVSLVTCLAWLGPQLLYDAVAVTRDDTTRSPDSYRFLDDLLVVPQGANSTHGYRVGFMICLQMLSGPVLSYYVWQYIVLVLPMAGVVTYCAIRLIVAAYTRKRDPPTEPNATIQSARFPFMTWSRSSVCQYGCRSNTFVDLALYYNFFWMVILRPIAMFHTLYMQRAEWGGAFYMDFGSHLVLAFSAVFSPFAVARPLSQKQERIITETINPIILKRENQEPVILRVVQPDVCPSKDGVIFTPDFTRPSFDKDDSYENISSNMQEMMIPDASVSLKNKEKPGEESMC